jgi:hypothetical protein
VRRFSLKRQAIYLAVHRIDETVYYRRMDSDEFQLLAALGGGKPVGEAIDKVFGESSLPLEDLRTRIEGWFSTWAGLGWFCRAGGESGCSMSNGSIDC